MVSINKYAQDDAWLVEIKTGNEAAAYEVYKRCRNACISVLRKSGLDQETAQDLYQDAFTIMVENVRKGKLAPPMTSTLSTYVTAVGKRLMLKYREKEKRHKADINYLENLPEEGAIELNHVLQELEHADNAQLVVQLLAQIGDRCRHLLQLVFLEEKDHKEVMEIMDFPSQGALRKKKFDCLKSLRALFG